MSFIYLPLLECCLQRQGQRLLHYSKVAVYMLRCTNISTCRFASGSGRSYGYPTFLSFVALRNISFFASTPASRFCILLHKLHMYMARCLPLSLSRSICSVSVQFSKPSFLIFSPDISGVRF